MTRRISATSSRTVPSADNKPCMRRWLLCERSGSWTKNTRLEMQAGSPWKMRRALSQQHSCLPPAFRCRAHKGMYPRPQSRLRFSRLPLRSTTLLITALTETAARSRIHLD